MFSMCVLLETFLDAEPMRQKSIGRELVLSLIQVELQVAGLQIGPQSHGRVDLCRRAAGGREEERRMQKRAEPANEGR